MRARPRADTTVLPMTPVFFSRKVGQINILPINNPGTSDVFGPSNVSHARACVQKRTQLFFTSGRGGRQRTECKVLQRLECCNDTIIGAISSFRPACECMPVKHVSFYIRNGAIVCVTN